MTSKQVVMVNGLTGEQRPFVAKERASMRSLCLVFFAFAILRSSGPFAETVPPVRDRRNVWLVFDTSPSARNCAEELQAIAAAAPVCGPSSSRAAADRVQPQPAESAVSTAKKRSISHPVAGHARRASEVPHSEKPLALAPGKGTRYGAPARNNSALGLVAPVGAQPIGEWS